MAAGQDKTPEPLGGVFEPDIIFPEEYFERRHADVVEPEKRLMLAILEDAINRTRSSFHSISIEAQRWISNTDRSWLFSFENVCEALDMEPSYIRRGLARQRLERLTLCGQKEERQQNSHRKNIRIRRQRSRTHLKIGTQ